MILATVSSISHVFLAALSPSQRYNAIRQLNSGGSVLTNKWFILLGASVVFILTILLLVVRRQRIERETREAEESFFTLADRRGMTQHERKVLARITDLSGLKLRDSIFTVATAFNLGASRLMRLEFSCRGSIAERRKLAQTINSVKEKLGFKKRVYPFGVRADSSKWLSSRQIPVGKKVSIVPSKRPQELRIDAVVLRNDDYEFVINPEVHVDSDPGQVWNVHYHFGAAVWEFDALTMACGEDGLVLNHSDNVRFINRRRFLRVSVDKPGLISHFPMSRTDPKEGLKAPEFIQARVTELSGPGLRVESEIVAKDGERVLLIFELDEGRQFEDIGIVRGYRSGTTGSSIGVELVGLSDSGVDELVRATNNVAMSYSVKMENKEPALVGGHVSG